jgi:hypothetical protein
MDHLADAPGAAQVAGVPDGAELFAGVDVVVEVPEVVRYRRKPAGTSDQGYKED